MSDDDFERREEEVGALSAIYGDDNVRPIRGDSGVIVSVRVSRTLDSDVGGEGSGAERRTVFIFDLPPGYPSSEPPTAVVNASWIARDARERTAREALQSVKSSLGEALLFSLTEHIFENCIKLSTSATATVATPTRPVPEPKEPADQILPPRKPLDIFSGQAFTDRKSSFQGHVVVVEGDEDIEAFLAQLKSNPKIAAASHNILAYRYTSRSGTRCQDYDDDGESAAGKRLLHLLQMMPEDGLAVVVSRWFGGIHLGPDRFKHINNVARETILAWRSARGETVQSRVSSR